jgi:hypothetical protein
LTDSSGVSLLHTDSYKTGFSPGEAAIVIVVTGDWWNVGGKIVRRKIVALILWNIVGQVHGEIGVFEYIGRKGILDIDPFRRQNRPRTDCVSTCASQQQGRENSDHKLKSGDFFHDSRASVKTPC